MSNRCILPAVWTRMLAVVSVVWYQASGGVSNNHDEFYGAIEMMDPARAHILLEIVWRFLYSEFPRFRQWHGLPEIPVFSSYSNPTEIQ